MTCYLGRPLMSETVHYNGFSMKLENCTMTRRDCKCPPQSNTNLVLSGCLAKAQGSFGLERPLLAYPSAVRPPGD